MSRALKQPAPDDRDSRPTTSRGYGRGGRDRDAMAGIGTPILLRGNEVYSLSVDWYSFFYAVSVKLHSVQSWVFIGNGGQYTVTIKIQMQFYTYAAANTDSDTVADAGIVAVTDAISDTDWALLKNTYTELFPGVIFSKL